MEPYPRCSLRSTLQSVSDESSQEPRFDSHQDSREESHEDVGQVLKMGLAESVGTRITRDTDSSGDIDFVNDGRVDRLTGLDAPEIFYLMLNREIALTDRKVNRKLLLITFTLKSRTPAATTAAQLIKLAQLIRSATRSEESISRLGRMTFVVILGVDMSPELDQEASESVLDYKYAAIAKRYSDQIGNFLDTENNQSLDQSNAPDIPPGSGLPTRCVADSESQTTYVDIDYFEREVGESLLDFLERAGV